MNIEWKQGGPSALRNLGDEEAIVSDDFAAKYGLDLGDRFQLLTQTRATPVFRVVGEFDAKLGVLGSVLVTQKVMARDFDQTQDLTDFVKVEDGANAEQVQDAADQRGRSRLSRSPKSSTSRN